MTAIIIMFIIHILYTQTCEIAQVLKGVHTVLYSLQYYCMYCTVLSTVYCTGTVLCTELYTVFRTVYCTVTILFLNSAHVRIT